MDSSEIKSKTLVGIIWQFLQKFITQIVGFVVTVVLARILSPSDYGVVSIASMFNILLGLLVSGSMDSALIQKKDIDELDCNTVFFSSLLMSVIIYGVIFLCAPLVADLFHNNIICPIMRSLALTLPIGSLAMVQNAIVSRDLNFKKFFYVSLFGQAVSAVVGIVMALNKFGAWALVGQNIVSIIANTITLFFLVKWHPRFMFSWTRFNSLFNFAWKQTASSLIGTFCDQLKGYLIGYKYTTSDLAFFNRGEGLPEMFKNNISGTIKAVLFPALSKCQDDKEKVKKGIRRSMMTSSFILTPIFFGLCAISDKIVPLLYSNKWMPSVPFMQIACLTCCVTILNDANLQSILAIGKSGEVLKVEFYKKPIMIFLLVAAIFISPLAISISMLFYSLYGLFVNSKLNAKYLNYPLWEQLLDIKAGLLLSLIMFVGVYSIGLVFTSKIIALCIQIPFGVVLYIILSEFFKPEAYVFVKDLLVNFIDKYKSSK